MDNSSLLRLVSPLSPTTRQTTRAIQVHTGVADPDPVFFTPGSVIRDGKNQIRNQHPESATLQHGTKSTPNADDETIYLTNKLL
jgi:hypothetical protein